MLDKLQLRRDSSSMLDISSVHFSRAFLSLRPKLRSLFHELYIYVVTELLYPNLSYKPQTEHVIQ